MSETRDGDAEAASIDDPLPRDRYPNGRAAKFDRATQWISRGLEELIHEADAGALQDDHHAQRPLFDLVIIGSGYGGAAAAAELAGCTIEDEAPRQTRPIRVCMLERGAEYLAGSFPKRFSELAGHVRLSRPERATPMGRLAGLFDVRAGMDVCALVGNGVGGGSLINAGVLEKPSDAVLASDRWPTEFRNDPRVCDLYRELAEDLGARISDHPNCVGGSSDRPAKYEALRRLAPEDTVRAPDEPPSRAGFRAAAISVALTDMMTSADVALDGCIGCGDCVTGCNANAKNSLDLNLLVQAVDRGMQLFSGATVLALRRPVNGDGWLLDVVHTDAGLRKRQRAPFVLRASRVIVAAGTFGSTELLLRSRLDIPNLGRRFSGNGDGIAAIYDSPVTAHPAARPSVAPSKRKTGPTITGLIDLRAETVPLAIEELGIPSGLHRLFAETLTMSNALTRMSRVDWTEHGQEVGRDPCAVDLEALDRSIVVAMMGDDGAEGLLALGGHDDEASTHAMPTERVAHVVWPAASRIPLYDHQMTRLEQLVAGAVAREGGSKRDGGIVLPNPLWRPLPEALATYAADARGPTLTVHPLGGCAMGETAASGAVDHLGRVFLRGDLEPLDDLVVLDGSIIPLSLGINPALTIAVVATRAARRLRLEWSLEPSTALGPASARRRPVFAVVADAPETRTPTEIVVVERQIGEIQLENAPDEIYVVEATMQFDPIAIDDLLGDVARTLTLQDFNPIDGRGSRLRVFRKCDLDTLRFGLDGGNAAAASAALRRMYSTTPDTALGRIAVFEAPLKGTLRLLHREPSVWPTRMARAAAAWIRNRLIRDWIGRRRTESPAPSIDGRGLFALLSRAGEVRRFDYDLRVGTPVTSSPGLLPDLREGEVIRGHKRITYAPRANPWAQLQTIELSAFPGLAAGSQFTLSLDPLYLARQRVPLIEIVREQSAPDALADLASLSLFLTRVIGNSHLWSFRAPDMPPRRAISRLPGALPGHRHPEVVELDVGAVTGTRRRAHVRLTRYRGSGARDPVAFIHGYSASGTTFAHPAIGTSLVSWLTARGHDCWVIDLRTSCGMPTARHPWTFEDPAFADIPRAIQEIHETTGRPVDVVAHCMGAAMFSISVLAPLDATADADDRARRAAMPRWIRSVVLSQAGPTMAFSDANTLRAYVMSYLRHFNLFDGYEFREDGEPTAVSLLADRLLATLPYPDDEIEIEQSVRRPWRLSTWSRTRRRMDALYGRAFALRDMSAAVLDRLDDFFGPMSIETVLQTMHMARHRQITDAGGRPYRLAPRDVRRWIFPTLSLHGLENGLLSPVTLTLQRNLFDQCEIGDRLSTVALAGFGHQDVLIGTRTPEAFQHISAFLDIPKGTK